LITFSNFFEGATFIYLFLVGRVFTGLFPAEDDEIYKEKEDEILPGSYQRTCRD